MKQVIEMPKMTEANYYCLNCGKKNIPIFRKRGRERETGHRKKMYCPYCKKEVNHIECKTLDDLAQFKSDFEKGLFIDEVEDSIAFCRDSRIRKDYICNEFYSRASG